LGRVIVPVEIYLSLAQEQLNDLERFPETCGAVIEWIAEGVVLRLMPTCARTEDEAPIADLVEAVSHLR
jgi:hypothetical protein